ncbi:unnamed protein product [Ostreobium quekettii]|uniref:Uncharacterized protein n=1 Tax=Ostreobium quekettii TaxID=121088 RepID=A0A8S1IVS6_9CHLO|nr:unnamed protein product [Ostreobium quekettii]
MSRLSPCACRGDGAWSGEHRLRRLGQAEGEPLAEPNKLSPKQQKKLDKKLIRLAARPADADTAAEVRSLLDAGANPDACCADTFGDTALHQTAEHNNAVVAEALLEAGANTESRDGFEGTPLHDAAHFDAFNVTVLLGGARCRGAFFSFLFCFVSVLFVLFRARRILRRSHNFGRRWSGDEPLDPGGNWFKLLETSNSCVRYFVDCVK